MSITRPLGFRAAATVAGLKKSGKADLALIVCDSDDARLVKGRGHPIEGGRTSAAVFTTNAVVGAPIQIGRAWRERVAKGGKSIRALLVNSGAANAATGEQGVKDALGCMGALAERLRCDPEEVLPSSTGVIGRRIPVEKVVGALPALVAGLARGEEADEAAARAIMTTDLVPKTAHREIELFGHQIHVGAIAKGSGMIAPRLDSFAVSPATQATMLAFITTDAPVHGLALQRALEAASRQSFDRVSVDAHPSCSDTVVAIASGAAPIRPIYMDTPEYFAFKAALMSICQDLAEQVVHDGEGATRTFKVTVRGARTSAEAERMARAVVDSPLVKCAVHGKDANWGRIVTAAGNAGVPFNPNETSLVIGTTEVYLDGVPTTFEKSDPMLRAAMDADPVEMTLTVGHGDGQAWMMGCDLSAEYVKINAEYTT
ncbi:MAG: bifunctional glutamate N-acetyltransferase/amino-acid acetyltransferase ArgJ [Phycisphaerales bacterium]|nr:bifunctional glutamate N-acetyltransferase/amino-acid acetyltransferase ArgJ [Phycisphaerales bacterium]